MRKQVLRTFEQLVADHADGNLQHELNEAYSEIIEDLENCVLEQGGKPKAKLVIAIDFTLDRGLYEVKSEIKKTLPKRQSPRSVYFCTEDNLLTRHNPNQPELPLRDVTSASVTNIKTA